MSEYNPTKADIQAVAKALIDECMETDNSNTIGYGGYDYCKYCGQYEFKKPSHHPECVVLVAQDLLT